MIDSPKEREKRIKGEKDEREVWLIKNKVATHNSPATGLLCEHSRDQPSHLFKNPPEARYRVPVDRFPPQPLPKP